MHTHRNIGPIKVLSLGTVKWNPVKVSHFPGVPGSLRCTPGSCKWGIFHREAGENLLERERKKEAEMRGRKRQSSPRHAHGRGEHRGSQHHYIWAPSPLLIATGGSIPLFCLEGVPAFPGAHSFSLVVHL